MEHQKNETKTVALMVTNNLLSCKVEKLNAQLEEKSSPIQRASLTNLMILEKQVELRKINSRHNKLLRDYDKLKLNHAKSDARKKENELLKVKLAIAEASLEKMRSRKNVKRNELLVAENRIFDISKQNNLMKYTIKKLEEDRFADKNRIHNLILQRLDDSELFLQSFGPINGYN